MAKSKKVENLCAVGHFFTCRWCRKKVEYPLMVNAEEYGWRIGGRRFCSYSHMRAWEREIGTPQGNKQLRLADYPDEERIAIFKKLERYKVMRDHGLDVDIASTRAGFTSYLEVQKFRGWWRTAEYMDWKREKEAT